MPPKKKEVKEPPKRDGAKQKREDQKEENKEEAQLDVRPAKAFLTYYQIDL